MKYAGYGIERGKLSVKVKYLVENRKLAAENNIYLDQLTFGEKVESPTATKLPVLLAVALLKDRNGVIDVNLPMSAARSTIRSSASAAIIVQVIVNLIIKAVTAPFALLGVGVVGGGEELAYLEFAPGSAALDAADEKKLKTLAKALAERPGAQARRRRPRRPRDRPRGPQAATLERQVKAAEAQGIREGRRRRGRRSTR